jgi:hypothetical protein
MHFHANEALLTHLNKVLWCLQWSCRNVAMEQFPPVDFFLLTLISDTQHHGDHSTSMTASGKLIYDFLGDAVYFTSLADGLALMPHKRLHNVMELYFLELIIFTSEICLSLPRNGRVCRGPVS